MLRDIKIYCVFLVMCSLLSDCSLSFPVAYDNKSARAWCTHLGARKSAWWPNRVHRQLVRAILRLLCSQIDCKRWWTRFFTYLFDRSFQRATEESTPMQIALRSRFCADLFCKEMCGRMAMDVNLIDTDANYAECAFLIAFLLLLDGRLLRRSSLQQKEVFQDNLYSAYATLEDGLEGGLKGKQLRTLFTTISKDFPCGMGSLVLCHLKLLRDFESVSFKEFSLLTKCLLIFEGL